MKVALFLDVDKTLTKNFIQEEYANLLSCKKDYQLIESNFQANQASVEFGERLIALFKEKKFDLGFATKHFEKIKLRSWADRLLKLKVDLFLVSNGPSYYIEKLAEKYNIPLNNVICSVYRFNHETQLISSCDAVSNAGKAEFVAEKAKNYEFSIGVGDSPRHDGPFLTNCSMSFIFLRHGQSIPNDQESGSFLYTTSLERVVRMVELISALEEKECQFGLQDITLKNLIGNTRLAAVRSLWFIFALFFSLGVFLGKFLKLTP